MAAVAALLAFVVALFPFAFFRNEAFIGDSDRLMHELPAYRHVARSAADGEPVGWNPAVFCGARAIGDPLTPSANLPMRALCRAFPESLATATTWRFIAEMALALVCGWLLFLPQAAHPLAAVLPALCLAASTAALENLNRGAAYSAFAWAVAALLALRDAADRPAARTLFLLVPCLYMQATASEIQHAAYFGLLLLFFLWARGTRDAAGRARPGRTFGAFLAAAAITAGLAAPQIIPFLDAAGSSDRVSWTLAEAWRNATHSPLAAARLFFPHLFGDGTSFPIGRLGPNTNELEMFPAYPGIAALFFGACALTRRRDRAVRPWLLCAAFLVLASLRTPLALVPHLAFLGKPLFHARLSHLVPFAFAFLVPAGLSAFLAMERPRQKRWALAALVSGGIALLLAGPFLAAWTGLLPGRLLSCFGQTRDAHDAYCQGRPVGTAMPAFPELARPALALFGAGAAALGGAAWLLASGRIAVPLFAGLVATVSIADFLQVGRATLQPFAAPEEKVSAPNPLSAFLAGLPDRDRHRVSIESFVPWPGSDVTADLFRYNLHAHHGLLAEGGYANFLDARSGAIQSLDRPVFRWKREAVADPYLADLCAVKYIVVRDTPGTRARYAPFCDLIFAADGAVVFAKRDARPRFRVVGTWDVLPAEAILSGFRARALPLDTAHLETLPPDDWRDIAPGAAGDVEILEETPNRIRGRARLPAPGILLSVNTWDPGWSAEVNGSAVPIERTNHAFQAVRLPAGECRFSFAYRYPGLDRLHGIAWAAGLLWLAAGAAGFPFRRGGNA